MAAHNACVAHSLDTVHHSMECACFAVTMYTNMCGPGPEPTVRPVRFWPDHFLLDAHPLLVNAWDWYLQRNRSNEML